MNYTLLSKVVLSHDLGFTAAENKTDHSQHQQGSRRLTFLGHDQQDGLMLGFSALPAGVPTSQMDK